MGWIYQFTLWLAALFERMKVSFDTPYWRCIKCMMDRLVVRPSWLRLLTWGLSSPNKCWDTPLLTGRLLVEKELTTDVDDTILEASCQAFGIYLRTLRVVVVDSYPGVSTLNMNIYIQGNPHIILYSKQHFNTRKTYKGSLSHKRLVSGSLGLPLTFDLKKLFKQTFTKCDTPYKQFINY